jgi:hypothetical protein
LILAISLSRGKKSFEITLELIRDQVDSDEVENHK